MRFLLAKNIASYSLGTFGEIRAGALKPCTKRKTLTESTSPPDRMVGVATAYVQVAPRGG
jgi:hypothetical protein